MMLQLVVNKKYRGQHVGTKLMHSIWGLSDAFAWGLYTSNPLTINALEEATMRKVNVRLIDKYIGDLKKVAYDLFDNDTKWLNSYHRGVVDTNFWTDHSEISKKIEYYESEYSRGFPLNKNLAEGHEWFAFTFRTQPISLRSR